MLKATTSRGQPWSTTYRRAARIGAVAALFSVVAAAALVPVRAEVTGWNTTVNIAVPVPQQIYSRRGPMRRSRTVLVPFDSAPFPYLGNHPRTHQPFLNYEKDGRKGRKTRSGRVLWADKAYSDSRVLLHIPRGFDARRPGLLVVFFHGHGATLREDVYARQRVTAQISRSHANAVLVAPQLAADAADSSPGKIWQPGGFARLLDEAAWHLGKLYGDRRARRTFANMPVLIIAYSGGYLATAWSLHHGGAGRRVRGVVLLDALYGELGKFNNWIMRDDSVFLVSVYARSTRARNQDMMRWLGQRSVAFDVSAQPHVRPGMLSFVDVGDDAAHRHLVTKAWTSAPIADLLTQMTSYRRGSGQARPAR